MRCAPRTPVASLSPSCRGCHFLLVGLDRVVLAKYKQVLADLARTDGRVGNQQSIVELLPRNAHTDEQAGHETQVLVLEDGARFERAGRRIDIGSDVVQVSHMRIAVLGL